MFPVLVIAMGLAVLAFGKRLPVLGAAVGAILGVALLRLFSISVVDNFLLALAIPGVLAAIGFFATGFVKVVVGVVLPILGALAGAAIVLTFLDIFGTDTSLIDWLLAALGAVVGVFLMSRFKDWGLIILAGLVGGLLVTRGLTVWFPTLEGGLGTLLVLVLAGGAIAYQGGLLDRRSAPTPT
jgi:hypothetical protein